MSFSWKCAIASVTFVLTTSLFPTAAQAQLETCVGPEETMETTELVSLGGPLVTLDHWSPAEQSFLVEYQMRFLTQCMGLPAMSAGDVRGGLYERDGFQDLINRARRTCKGDTGGYGTHWDRFLGSLRSLPGLCGEA